MTIKRLAIQNLRNLEAVDISPAAHLNILYGDNGSGKTSVLEAISVLSLARSFRSRKIKSLIRHQQTLLTVFGRLKLISSDDADVDIPVGVQRDLNGLGVIKVNGRIAQTASELTEYLPFQIMNGHSFLLLEGAPQERRHFMDWLVFHVEHDFLSVWKDFQKALKQRNSLLRHDKIDRLMLSPWEVELASKAERLDQLRAEVFAQFLVAFESLVTDFIAIDGLKLDYYRGWDRQQPYAELLVEGQVRDQELGYTRVGPQRADIRITILGQPAAEILSRGQQKLLVSALRIAQALVFQQVTQRQCVYLIDDLPAELDSHYQRVLAGWLDRLGCQVFVTGVEKQPLLNAWPTTEQIRHTKVFHVEHGLVTDVTEQDNNDQNIKSD